MKKSYFLLNLTVFIIILCSCKDNPTEESIKEIKGPPVIITSTIDTLTVGQTVKIIGKNLSLDKKTEVKINKFSITQFDIWNDSLIAFKLPYGVKSGKMLVENSYGSSNTVNIVIRDYCLVKYSDNYAYQGDTATIQGYFYFSNLHNEYLDYNDKRINPLNITDTSITFLVPDYSLKPGEFTSNSLYFYNDNKSYFLLKAHFLGEPYLVDISPKKAYNGVVMQVKVKGYTRKSYLCFNGNVYDSIDNFDLYESTLQRIFIFNNSGDITIKTGKYISNSIHIDYMEPVKIDSISKPTCFYGDTVSIFGKNFGSQTTKSSIVFNNEKIYDYLSWSDNQIKFIIPNNAYSGNIKVIVEENYPSNEIPISITIIPRFSDIDNFKHIRFKNKYFSLDSVKGKWHYFSNFSMVTSYIYCQFNEYNPNLLDSFEINYQDLQGIGNPSAFTNERTKGFGGFIQVANSQMYQFIINTLYSKIDFGYYLYEYIDDKNGDIRNENKNFTPNYSIDFLP